MAFFNATNQFDVNSIADLADPLVKTKTTTGYAISGSSDVQVTVEGNLSLTSGQKLAGTVTALTYFKDDFRTENFWLTGMSSNINTPYHDNGYKVDGVTVGANSVTGEMAYWLRGSDVLYGNYYGDNLAGFAGNDLVHALEGNDTVIGWSGNDTIYGEVGADLIYGDNTSNTASTAYTGNDKLYGGAGDDSLYGCGGNDVLDAGSGLNYLDGGLGNDTYYVYNIDDWVYEAANGGIDTVYSSVTFGLYYNQSVENLTLTGSEDWLNAFGNNLQNVITGNAGNNLLDGGINSNLKLGDRLVGGDGNDGYQIYSTKDVVVEKLNEGIDTISVFDLVDIVASKNIYSIASTANVEDIRYWGSKEAVLTGNNLNNNIYVAVDAATTLSGGLGKDYLEGGGGSDVLDGGADNDTLWGRGGDDKFVMNTKNFDLIMDFKGESLTDADKLYFNPVKFTRLKIGVTFDEVDSSTEVTSSTVAIVFNTENSMVYYNATGKAGGAVAIANLVGISNLSSSDIVTSLAG